MADNNIHITKYILGERVWIIDAEVVGRVKEILITQGCIDFRVAYFDEDKRRCTEWFSDSELRSTESKKAPQDSI